MVQLDQVAIINNLARIEVYTSPTPESPGAALAGGVNLVPRGAFERARPQFNASVSLMMRDTDHRLRQTPGPFRAPTSAIHPGFDFSWVVPVNKRFGFTFSGGSSTQFMRQDTLVNIWRGGYYTTNVAATATTGYPDTTPDRPYLSECRVYDGPKVATRTSGGATLDYRLGPQDRMSVSLQHARFTATFNGRQLSFITGRVLPGNFSPWETNGARGFGSITQTNINREKTSATFMPTLRYFHDGPAWKIEAGVGSSRASNHYRDIDKGFFNNASTRREGVTVRFSDIFYLRPRVISVTEGANDAPVDPYSLASYVLNSGASSPLDSTDLRRSVNASLRRDFAFGRVPVSLKVGGDVVHSARDMSGGVVTFTHVGADGRASTTPADPLGTDDGAAFLLDEVYSQRIAPFGYPRIQWLSNYKYWEYYTAHPERFAIDRNTAYRNAVSGSRYAAEIVSSGFLRGDAAFFDRRLKLVGGVRAEQTNIKAQGALTDLTRNFRRDASGNILRAANGQPLTIAPANTLEYSQLTYLDRGSRVRKEYLRWFPSLNASYNVRENLVARLALFRSIGRPDYDQYAGALTLPNPEYPPNPLYINTRISVNNAGIKAWSANTAKLRFEYYFEGVGQISIGGFRRHVTNFFASGVLPATPEFLRLHDLDPEVYGAYPVATNYNLPGTVRMEGLECDYKQALTFLPGWGRGFQVFANASTVRATGESSPAFSDLMPRAYNWGVSYSRLRYNLRVNWNYRGRARAAMVTGRGIEPGTAVWRSKRLYIDVHGEYAFARRFTMFANLRNVGAATEDYKVIGPSTPPHAQFLQRGDNGALWTFGLKGVF
jgi:TonB-dependent receptor